MRTAKKGGARSDPEEDKVRELVRAFERSTLPLDSFKHDAHLSVALFYLTRLPVCAATARFRAAIKRFIAHYGETGYNETITMFWLNQIVRFLMKSETDRTFSDLLGTLLERYGDSGLIYSYYSRERLQSDDARTTWLAPDIKGND